VQTRVSPASLGALNFGIQMIWGAVLAVSLQARSVELAGPSATFTYAALAATGAAVATIVQILIGISADRRRSLVGHRNEFYLAGAAIALPALWWFYSAPSIGQLSVAVIALQIGMNVLTGPYQAAIPDYMPIERSGTASSWLSAYQSFGNAAGLLVAGFVKSPRLVALILSFALVASLAVTFLHVYRIREKSSAAAEPLSLKGPLGTLLISRGAINIGFYTMLGYLLFFVRESLGIAGLDAQRTQTALLFLTFTIVAIAGAVIAARPADRADKRLVASLAIAGIVVALIALALAPALPVAFAACACAGAAWGAFVTADWALACAMLPRGAMATSMGIWNVATTLPQVAAPLIAAPLVSYFDRVELGLGPRAAILVATLAFSFGAAYLWRLPAQMGSRPEAS